jgi:hypothetical protein
LLAAVVAGAATEPVVVVGVVVPAPLAALLWVPAESVVLPLDEPAEPLAPVVLGPEAVAEWAAAAEPPVLEPLVVLPDEPLEDCV